MFSTNSTVFYLCKFILVLHTGKNKICSSAFRECVEDSRTSSAEAEKLLAVSNSITWNSSTAEADCCTLWVWISVHKVSIGGRSTVVYQYSDIMQRHRKSNWCWQEVNLKNRRITAALEVVLYSLVTVTKLTMWHFYTLRILSTHTHTHTVQIGTVLPCSVWGDAVDGRVTL